MKYWSTDADVDVAGITDIKKCIPSIGQVDLFAVFFTRNGIFIAAFFINMLLLKRL